MAKCTKNGKKDWLFFILRILYIFGIMIVVYYVIFRIENKT